CIYPFQDNATFKASILDKRQPNTHKISQKRTSSTIDVTKALPDNRNRSVKKRCLNNHKSLKPTIQNALHVPTATVATLAVERDNTADSVCAELKTMSNKTASSVSASTVAKPLSAVPLTDTSSVPPSPADNAVPDLTFDFLPNESWTTPVTPPDNVASSSSHSCKDSTNASATVVGTTSPQLATNLESLLFDGDFGIDFGNLDATSTMTEFDADFEAILQQF
ncbi:hypothetical protein BX616_001470, partial [Lobosporangium transversale]